jgi:amidase
LSDDDICYLTATEALALFEKRELSPVELMEAQIRRAERVEPVINAFADTYFDEARQQAKVAEERYMRSGPRDRRPLDGVPVAVKDAQRVAGKRTTYGSLLFKDNVDDRSDPIVERLVAAGAIVHARTTTPEFCLSGTCETRMYGKTRNPWNAGYGPGGSSGGSGASLAAGTSVLATGTDIGGSIRIPASCCGVVGYKPPKGRNPDGPPANFDPYNHCGPLARSVADAALFQNIVSGAHPLDHHSLREKVQLADAVQPVAGLRVAWSMDLGYVRIAPEVRRNTLAALDVFRQLGCIAEEVDLGWSLDSDRAAMAWYNAMHFGRQTLWHAQTGADLMTDYALAAAQSARTLAIDDIAKSWETQHAMYQKFGPMMERFDIFICPTTSIPALSADHDPLDQDFRIDGQRVDPEYGWVLTHQFNMLFNSPVMSLPSGRAETGVPTGIQIVGRTFDDATVFRAALAYEQAVGGWFGEAARPNPPEGTQGTPSARG